MRMRAWGVALSCLLVGAGCATARGGEGERARGVPGFDLRDYPGREAMAAWLESSPYRWVGFYLPAPCYTGTSWQGRREEIERMGWGVAVLFIGEQDWSQVATPARSPAPADPPVRCTHTNLTAEQGVADAKAASAAAADEGFPRGTVIYLNVERVDSVTPRLAEYVAAWFDALLREGVYEPGLYAHERNARELYALASAVFERSGRSDSPRLWIASARDFSLDRAPADSPIPSATVWQGAFDRTETWGGVSLRIDASVATSASPSR